MNTKILLGAGALIALIGCVDKGPCGDSGDSGVCVDSGTTVDSDSGLSDCEAYTGATYLGIDRAACDVPPEITAETTAVGWNCDAASYWYDFYTVGWADSGSLYIYQTRDTPPWDEAHTVPVYESSENGHWDNLYLVLEITDDYTQVEDGVKTLYDCSDEMNSGLTWHLEVNAGGSLADCAVWGHDTAALGTGCDVW